MPDQNETAAGTAPAVEDTFESLEREMEAAGLSLPAKATSTSPVEKLDDGTAGASDPILDRIRNGLKGADQAARSEAIEKAALASVIKKMGGAAVMEAIAATDPDALRYVPVGTAQAEGMGEFDWCSTFVTRTRFYPLAPEKNAYDIADIAHSLSRSNRWGGHINVENFSVAQHSVHVMEKLRHPAARFIAILHDAPEYILSDMPRPIKRHVPGYSEIEKKHEIEIFKRHGIRFEDLKRFWPSVKIADDAVLREESLVLQEMSRFPDDWHWQPMSPNAAKQFFLDAYEQARDDYRCWLGTDEAKDL